MVLCVNTKSPVVWGFGTLHEIASYRRWAAYGLALRLIGQLHVLLYLLLPTHTWKSRAEHCFLLHLCEGNQGLIPVDFSTTLQ